MSDLPPRAQGRRYEELPNLARYSLWRTVVWQLGRTWLCQLRANVIAGLLAGISGAAVIILTAVLLRVPGRSLLESSNVPEALATALAAVIWWGIVFIVVLVWAAFAAPRRIAEQGSWQGRRFVFHEPITAATFLAGPEDNKKRFIVTVKDAPKFSVVYLILENPSNSRLLRATPQSPFFAMDNWEILTANKPWPTFADGSLEGAVRIGKLRQFYVEWLLPQNAVPHELRVKITSFEIQEPNQTDKFRFFNWRVCQPKNGFDIHA